MTGPLVTLDSLPAASQIRIRKRCAEFEAAWHSGSKSDVDEFLKDSSDDELSILLHELLCVEVRLKSEQKSTPTREQYLKRFKGREDIVENVFQLFETGRLTTAAPGEGETAKQSIIAGNAPDATIDEASTGAPDQPTVIQPIATMDESESPATTVRRSSDVMPHELGGYQILGELGKGGMGIVYRARQKNTDRLVALKVIRPDRLTGISSSSKKKAIERFQNEARAAAKIEHDHLVTVYEVGEADGCHYFSMRYVEGTSLSEVLRDGPVQNRQAAEWLEPICRAVHAAHEQHVLHRDLKPHNIMLDRQTGKTLVADFGLAHLAENDTALTQTGDAMGTPPYMPPEQFRDAAHVEATADIYSLGATLYHLLGGRPPFQAARSVETMRQVMSVDPISLRRLNPEIDRDLETIAMKCLSKEPARRYESAEALADELKRYLDGRPILARPLGPIGHLWRWCRRNPVPAGFAAVAAVSVAVTVTALVVTNIETEKAYAQSEASFQDAMSAVNEFFTRVSEDRLLNEPGNQDLRHDLLEMARRYYVQLLERRSDDPTLQVELAATHFRLGLILEVLDSPATAVAPLQKAERMQRQQLAAAPDSTEARTALSNTLVARGQVAAKTGELDKAFQFFEEALQIRNALVDDATDADGKLEAIRLASNAKMNLGLVMRRLDDRDGARKSFEEAQSARKEALPHQPEHRKLRRDLAKGYYNLANLGLDEDDANELEANLDQAIRILEELLTENPNDLSDRYMLALCLQMRGDLLGALAFQDTSQFPPAMESYTQARASFEELVSRNPHVDRYRLELGKLLMGLGLLTAENGDKPASRNWFAQARESVTPLAKGESSQAVGELLDTIEHAIELLDAPPDAE